MKPVHVYVAGPIGTDPELRSANIANAVAACLTLVGAGHRPFTPHLNCQVDPVDSLGYETWMTFDLAWLERCDALIRLPGKSPGADREVNRAHALGLPVFYGVEAFLLDPRGREDRFEQGRCVARIDEGYCTLPLGHGGVHMIREPEPASSNSDTRTGRTQYRFSGRAGEGGVYQSNQPGSWRRIR